MSAGVPSRNLVGHRADRAELARDIKAGLLFEFGCKAADEALRRAAAQNLQRTHDESFHGRDQAIARDRQVAKPHTERIEHGIRDRRRDRAMRGFAGADRIDIGAGRSLRHRHQAPR